MSAREPWPRFLARASAVLILVLSAGAYLAGRFRIGVDDQVPSCLPYQWWLIDTHDRAVVQGETYAFAALGMGPFFQDGQTVIKIAAGLPGDRVSVTRAATRVNGRVVGEGLALCGTLQREPEDFTREAIVPAGSLWMMGGTIQSFDSRYWGFLPQERLIGRVYALW